MLFASCTGRAVVRRMSFGVDGQALYMLYSTLNCIQRSVVEAFMPELEGEWCNHSCICATSNERAEPDVLRSSLMSFFK